MKRLLYFTFISITFFSCQKTNVKDDTTVIAKTPSKTYTFNLDFIRHRANFGRFIKNDTTFFYFYHHLYSQQIDIYNEQQKKVDSISLSKYTTDNNPVMFVEFLNSDTLSLRTKRGIVYLINSNSNVLKTIDINTIQSQLNDTLLEVHYHITYSDTYQGALISTFNGKGNPYGSDQYCDLLRYFMKKNIDTKRLILIDNVFADSLTIHHSIKNLEQAILDSGYFADIMYKTYFINSSLIMYPSFLPTLYQVSLKNGIVKKIIPIKSKHSHTIFIHHIATESSNKECLKGLETYAQGYNDGMIESIYYSNYTQQYYVAVRHKKQTDNDNEKRYSILSYDTDFNKIGETDLMFNPVGIWSEKGVYIYEQHNNMNEKQIQLKYYEFIK